MEAGKIVDKWKITSLENLIPAVGKARTSPLWGVSYDALGLGAGRVQAGLGRGQ